MTYTPGPALSAALAVLAAMAPKAPPTVELVRARNTDARARCMWVGVEMLALVVLAPFAKPRTA